MAKPPPRPPRGDTFALGRESGGGSDTESSGRRQNAGSGSSQSILVAAASKPAASSSVAARFKARADELKGVRVLPADGSPAHHSPPRTPVPEVSSPGPPQATVAPRSMTTRAAPKLMSSHTSPRLKPPPAEPTLDDGTEDTSNDRLRWGRAATADETYLGSSAPVYVSQPTRPLRKGAAATQTPRSDERASTDAPAPAPFSYMQGPSSTSPSSPSPVGTWSTGTDVWAGLGAERAALSESGFEKRSPRGAVPATTTAAAAPKQRAMFGTQRGLAAAAPVERRGPPPAGFMSKTNSSADLMALSSAEADSAESSDTTPNGADDSSQPLSPRGPSSTAGAKGDKRTHIVNEIVSTERSYIQSIELLIKVFQPALKILINDPSTQLKVDDVRRMFSNIDMIIPLNKELLKDLEARVTTWSAAQLIGDVFLTHAPYLKMYTDYSNNYNAANKLYLDLITNDLPFYEVMEACKAHQDNTKHESLESVLIMPVQRIPRYNLLLDDLLKNTPQDHSDYPNIQKALGKMKDVADHINKSVQQQENLRRLMEASNKGTGFRGLLEAHRKLIRDGTIPISYGYARKPTDKLHFFLFNDLLVYARPSDVKKQADMSKAETKYPLMLVWVKEHAEGVFEIIAPGCSFGIHPTTAEEKNSWLSALKEALRGVYSAQLDCTEENRFSKYQVYDEGMYEGWWVNGRPHGQGSFALFGNEYTGEWREGMKAGKGTFTYATGEVYEGDWETDVPCGRGVLTHPSGDRYVGEFLRGKKHGRGEFIYIDGARYVGDWKDNVASGQGKLTWRNGIIYDGSWADGVFHGYGMISNSRGEMYRGDWVNGKKEGKGVMTWVGSSYDGWWKADKFNGQGTHSSEAAKTQFVGTWENGEKHGRGVMTYPDGSKYDGEWKSGERHGKASFHMANGDRYVGTFKHGEFHGKGTYTYRNGTKIEGTWEKGVRDGEFTLYLPAMKKLTGVAKDEVVSCKLNKEKVDFTLGPKAPVFEFEF